MGKRKLCTGIIIGAIVGGITALFDKDARTYAQNKLSSAKASIKNPSDAIHNVRVAFDQFNGKFSSGAENAINALEQVEQTLDKFTKKTDKIEG